MTWWPAGRRPRYDAVLVAGVWCTPPARTACEVVRTTLYLRRVLPHASPLPDSPMESRARWRYIEGGLPAPVPQVPVGTRFLDLGWEEEPVAGEHDGLDAHMTREQLREDRRRHNEITAHRWALLHLTDHDVHRGPGARPPGAGRRPAPPPGPAPPPAPRRPPW
ncbi:hypothetical protein [Klenkia soli]|uniref:hypothetical protein n=1 Tax=Klenkia soli TaxID=1052260 RepID=UPI000B840EC5|nr:hypothetical protein [Klenkia soli]